MIPKDRMGPTVTRSTGSAKATSVTSTAGPFDRKARLSERFVDWVKAHRTLSSWVGTIIMVVAALFVWTQSTQQRSQDIASRELQGARFAFESKNLPLAASELARIIENHRAPMRLRKADCSWQRPAAPGQPQQAIEVMRDYAPGAGREPMSTGLRAPRRRYENLGRFREAGEAYESCSNAAGLDF
jgi:hypothetical protein